MEIELQHKLESDQLTEYDEIVIVLMTHGFYKMSRHAANWLLPLTNEIVREAITKMMRGE